MRPGEDREQLPRAPVRMSLSGREQELADMVGRPVRAGVRSTAPISETAAALVLEARQPFVADPPADTVASAEVRHCEAAAERVAHEAKAFVRDGSPSRASTDLDERNTSRRLGVLPMYLDRTVTYVPGPYRFAA
jgi:hypothetical protein